MHRLPFVIVILALSTTKTVFAEEECSDVSMRLAPVASPDSPRGERHSPAMMAAGIAVTATGGVAMIAGTTLVLIDTLSHLGEGLGTLAGAVGSLVTGDPLPDSSSKAPGLLAPGIGLLIGGSVGVAVGIPLIVVGKRREPFVELGAQPGGLVLRGAF